MKRIGCPKGFEFHKKQKQCIPIYKHFPDWVNFQKIQYYLENKNINYNFDKYGLVANNIHLDIMGENDVMQPTGRGWDVDYSQDPEVPINSALDFFAGLYKNPKWQKEFSDMFYEIPHIFTAQEQYNMMNLIKDKKRIHYNFGDMDIK